MIEEIFISMGKWIISYGQGNISKKFPYSNVTFISILYVYTLVNNLYSVSRPNDNGSVIDIIASGEIIFRIADTIIGFVDEVKG